ncbi:hypothetical protein GF351_03350 [Candidatus Woesearchaeota archaeon]|nr:hypothetical protein [Candidatus Woesearchaeota archaeon]
MQPKITFLGTGGDSFLIGKQIRASGGIIVQAGDHQLHLDPGPGTLVRAAEYGINLRENTAVLVSSPSILKCNDINAVLDAMSYGGMDINGVLLAASQLVNGTDNESGFLKKKHSKYVERVLAVRPEQRIGIENVEVRVLKTSAENNVGFKVFTPDFVFSYSSATSYEKSIAEQYHKSDILVLDVQLPQEETAENCLSRHDATRIVNLVKPRLTVLTGFSKRMLEADPLYEAREVQKATGCQVVAANDGMVINPVSYSASMKQKTLNLYPHKGPEAGHEPVTFTEIEPEEPEPAEEQKPQDKQSTLGQ